MPDGYEERFRRACAIFAQQRVSDPRTERTVGVHGECRAEEAGPEIPPEIAPGIAAGLVDPRTREPFEKDERVPKADSAPSW